MNNELVKIDDLSLPLQQKAVQEFAKFYIRLFKHENLEIVANISSNFVVDINDVINRNRHLNTEDLIERSSAASFKQYLKILEKIDQSYYDTGNVQISWSDWEAEQQNKLATA
ncbi:hypothetical protein LOOC260_104930 [Paucilactobacillus hokkaidonensis JCM 18461]|uniref:Uncharacterized protein n=2 Tax=Paucilactobacillus hokkaidonensis TaxID=1193095 RepID=A0A0A1GX61_9LACO|nr:hypothetical protein [Paucilactobacillus hokkaidonensis]KRO11392.1 hypothetical protein IV59_GL000132 [Paucilactobacillus hokkaidonensis]BAP85056.1 hypothetical protein LOOC260_104930 [Paucilactobacillus hokkaidonensis JCM 18461]